ncbi:hypothetical protein CKAH01_08348 [Colletotrichum kahawae]|uniref:Uncharacterized protein n=1 Tax=Colletotrichum kahawae TaxID=34407 RepID=A0AAD9Y3Y5_COLKA|nr:hypothetical protein CKAH01_08348 [Colletotrichum kahawae]
MFRKLCGNKSMRNVIMVTTGWDNLGNEQAGKDRESQLKESTEWWGYLIARGAQTRKFNNTRESAIDIVSGIVDFPLTTLQVQEEMAVQSFQIGSTAVGQVLKEQLSGVRVNYEQQIKEIRLEKNEALQDKDDTLVRMLEKDEARLLDRLKEIEKQEAELQANGQTDHSKIDSAQR